MALKFHNDNNIDENNDNDDLEKEVIEDVKNSTTELSSNVVGYKDLKESLGKLKNKKVLEGKVAPELISEKEKSENSSDVQALKLKNSDRKEDFLELRKVNLIKQKNRLYYKVSNHCDLYYMGNRYYNDFKNGLQNFGFVSQNDPNSIESMIVGLAGFFNHVTDVSICIFSWKIKEQRYFRYLTEFEERKVYYEDLNLEITYYESDLYNIVDLYNVILKNEHLSSEEIVSKLIDKFDINLWDIPDLNILSKEKSVFFPFVNSLDNVTIIASKLKTKYRYLNKLKDYFEKLSTPIKGIVFDD